MRSLQWWQVALTFGGGLGMKEPAASRSAQQVGGEGRLRSLLAVQLQGTLRIILEPLLVDKPFVGAVTMFFLQQPVSPQDEAGLPLPVNRR